MAVSWDTYLKVPRAAEQYAACYQSCHQAFEQQRENIRRVFAMTSPAPWLVWVRES